MNRIGFLLSLGMILAATFAAAQSARADIGDLYTGAREAAMGGACTAVTEGDEAIYLNPAAMAGNKGTEFLTNMDLGVSKDAVGQVNTAATYFKNISPSTLNNFMNQSLGVNGTVSPSILFPNFGISFLVDQQLALLVQNEANPQVQLGFQTTNGVQLAGGFSVLGRRGKNAPDDLRVGLGYKFMFRRGGYYTLTEDQILNISESTIKGVVGSYGEGQSGDLGLQYIHKFNRRVQFLAGLDWAQIGNMSFSSGSETQEQNLAVGIGTKMMLGREAGLTLAYDLKYLTDTMEFQKRNHFGFDLQLLNFDFYGGLNDGYYLSGGVGLNLWLLKLTALTYEQELDAYSGQLGERLYMLRITFDVPI